MADPLWINADAGAPAYTANELRQGFALPMAYDGRAVGARQGVRPGGTQLQVTLVGSTITVAPGLALMDPGLTTTQGPYWTALDTAETHTLTAANATNPRKDIVVLRVYDDDEDSSGQREAVTEYLVGTAAASPSEPTVPAGAMQLATIDVPVSGGGSAVVTDRRVFTVAVGGIAVGTPTGGYAGQWRDAGGTTGALERFNGTTWEPTVRLGNSGTVEIGDANLYRSAANLLTTDDNLKVGAGSITLGSAVKRASLAALGQVSNTTTETVVATLTIPANDAVVGATYRIRFLANVSFAASAVLTWRCRLGGVAGTNLTGIVSVTLSSTAQTTKESIVECDLVCLSTGASGTWFAMIKETRNTTSTGAAVDVQLSSTTGSPVRDTTVSQAMVITAQWGGASASNQIAGRGICERIA